MFAEGWYSYKKAKTHYFVNRLSGYTPIVSLCRGGAELDEIGSPDIGNTCGNCRRRANKLQIQPPHPPPTTDKEPE